MAITKEPACPESFDGDDCCCTSLPESPAKPQPPEEPNPIIFPKTIHRIDREKYVSLFKLVWRNLHLLDPPKAPKIDEDALRALGLLEFVHIDYPSPISSHRNLLAEFISFFNYDLGRSFFCGCSIIVNRDVFGKSLKLPLKALSSPPPKVAPEALASAATKFMETYILPVYKRTSESIDGYSDQVERAMKDVKDNVVYRVDWLSLIWEEALKELLYMIDDLGNKNITWDCFYSAYWLRLIWVKNPNIFPADVVLESSVHVRAANVPLQQEGDVVMEPETPQPHESSGQMSTSPKASMIDGYRKAGNIDSQEAEDGDSGDIWGPSVDNVNMDCNLPQLFEGLKQRSATSPDAVTAREGLNTLLEAIEAITNSHSDSGTETPAKNSRVSESHSNKKQTVISDTRMQTPSAKRKIADGSCSEIIRKKRGLSTLFEHLEVQKDLNKEAPSTSPEDSVGIHLKTLTELSKDWDATIAPLSQIEQSVEEIVQQYVEKVATVFDFSTLPPAPKKLDCAPGTLLQLPASACSRTKFAFRTIISSLKNLQTLANAEPFNQQSFLEEVTVMLDGWENFLSSHFTEEIKQMVTKLKFLKKELDDELGQQPQSTMDVLSERNKQASVMLEEAVLVRRHITQSVMEIEQMKLAGEKNQESLNVLETAHTNNIEELEKKLKEEKENLRVVQSLKAKNADFLTERMASSQAIAICSTRFEEVTAKGNALSKEIAKRRQQVEEDGGLPAPLQALRYLIACYPIKK